MKRASVSKANWSEIRESDYNEYCDQILFDKKLQLVINDNEVYIKSDNEEIFLLKISKPKSMWYEIWLQLKSI